MSTDATTTAIKIEYNGDIRRTSLSSTSFEAFKAAVTRLFGEAAGSQKVRYVDEDGDRVLVCNSQDIAEAFKQAKSQKKTIKFFVETTIKGEGKATEPSAPVATNAAFGKVEVTDEPDQDEIRAKAAVDEQEDEQQAEAKRSFQQKAGFQKKGGCRWRKNWQNAQQEFWKKREEERKQFEEDIQAFLSDEKVVKALQDTLPAVADALLKGEKLRDVLDNSLEAQPALKEHKLTQRLLPIAHQVLEMMAPMSAFLGPVLLDVVLDLQALLANGKLEDMPAHRLMKRMFSCAKRAARGGPFGAPPCLGFGGPMMFGGGRGNCPFPFWAMGGGRMGGDRGRF